ncbi:multifunctional protein 2 [Actinidia rufa]|uniref:Multifunctional protein 2 n=1 Tax=Actinidia rufa TaxID=165716 RepID=A0A7J0E2N3_9ERIC|nr:multifunctional protein 2 [Actinidia rufa]
MNQVQGDYLAKDLQMMAYLDEVKAMSMKIKDFKIRQILREESKKADALANLASTFDFISDRSVLMDFLPNSSINVSKTYCQVVTDPTIPKAIISDNARQFDNNGFSLFYLDLAIFNHFSLSGNPQANDQVKVINRMILRNLKEQAPNSSIHSCIDVVELGIVSGPVLDCGRKLKLSRTFTFRYLQELGPISLLNMEPQGMVPGITDRGLVPRQIKKVAILGGGLMGSGIATALILSNYPVVLKEVNEKFLQGGLDRVRGEARVLSSDSNLQSRVKKGKMTQEKLEKTLSLLKGALDYESFRDVDMVIEAVIENVSLKQQIFADLEKYCPPHCILASNTSTIDLNLIGEKTKSQDRIIGAHFFRKLKLSKDFYIQILARAWSTSSLLNVEPQGKMVVLLSELLMELGLVFNAMVPGITDRGLVPRQIKKVAILGGGLMGSGIATALILSNYPVVLKEVNEKFLQGGLDRVRGEARVLSSDSNLQSRVKKGKMTQEKLEKTLSLLKGALDYESFRDVDMVIEIEEILKFVRAQARIQAPNLEHPLACIDVVELGIVSGPRAGLWKEVEAFQGLLHSDTCKSLVHIFFAQRGTSRVPGITDRGLVPRQIKKVAILGGGLMGSGIATALILSNYPVVLKEVNEKFLQGGLDRVRGEARVLSSDSNLQSRVKKGKMTQEKLEKTLSLLKGALDYESFRDVDMVIEAVIENVSLKQQIFADLEKYCPPHCILASNTSTIDLNLIGEKTKSQDRIIGAHFFRIQAPNLEHPLACIDVVELGIVSGPRAGLWKEVEAFQGLLHSDTCKSLVHIFFAQRGTSRVPGITDRGLVPRQIKKVAILGGGLMGSGIATALILSNYPVVLKEVNEKFLQGGLDRVRGEARVLSSDSNLQSRVKKGKMTQEKLEKTLSLLKGALDYESFRDVDMVIEIEEILKFVRAQARIQAPNLEHPLACIDVVELGIVSGPRAGLWKEVEAFQGLLHSDTCKSLVHIFFAQRGTSRVPGITDRGLVPRQIKKVAILGGGLMGSGIATALILSNYPVVLKEVNEKFLQGGLDRVRGEARVLSSDSNLQSRVKKGKMTQEKLEKTLSLLKGALDYESFRDVDMVIEIEEILKFVRAQARIQAPNLEHPLACIDVVELGIVSGPRAGLWKEVEAFQGLLHSDTCKSLVHIFFAQRGTSRVPGITDRGLVPRQIKKVAILGGGLMGSGIATALILSNYPVVLKEVNEKFLQGGLDRVRGEARVLSSDSNLQSRVKKGKMTQEKLEKTLSLLKGALDYESFRDVDMVIEEVELSKDFCIQNIARACPLFFARGTSLLEDGVLLSELLMELGFGNAMVPGITIGSSTKTIKKVAILVVIMGLG